MEEKVFEMEYVINGEKYLITATKVGDVEVPAPVETFQKMEDSFVFEDGDLLKFNVSDIPDGMDISTWLEIVKNYGIMLVR